MLMDERRTGLARALFVVVISAVVGEVNSIPWNGPKSTSQSEDSNVSGWSAKPTPAPQRKLMAGLMRRATNEFNVCGYVSGNKDDILTCDDDGFTCFISSSIGAHGCCAGPLAAASDCRMHTRCVNEYETCTGECIKDPLIKRCHNPTPSCGTWLWEDGFSSFECDTVSFQAPVSSPEIPERIKPDSTSGTIEIPYTEPTSSSTTPNENPEEDLKEEEDTKPKSNIPTIAGATGGSVIIIVIFLLVGLLYRRRRRERNSSLPTASSIAALSKKASSNKLQQETFAPKEIDGTPIGISPYHTPIEVPAPPGGSPPVRVREEEGVWTNEGLRVEMVGDRPGTPGKAI